MKHFPAIYWPIPEPIQLLPIPTSRVNWFNVVTHGSVSTPAGPMQAVTLAKRDLEIPSQDLMGHIGKPLLASEVDAASAPRIMFWRGDFWMVARDARRPIEFGGRWRLPGGGTNGWAITVVYQINIADAEQALASISAI